VSDTRAHREVTVASKPLRSPHTVAATACAASEGWSTHLGFVLRNGAIRELHLNARTLPAPLVFREARHHMVVGLQHLPHPFANEGNTLTSSAPCSFWAQQGTPRGGEYLGGYSHTSLSSTPLPP
jgi:hypothetical protein